MTLQDTRTDPMLLQPIIICLDCMLDVACDRFIPGWDTHGLPIELKVLQSLPSSERAALDTLGLRAKAKEFALNTIEQQKEQFKR